MKKALPLAIAMLFVCPILKTSTVLANDGMGGGSTAVHHESWLDKAWDDFLHLFGAGHHNDNKGNKNGQNNNDQGDDGHKGPGHRDGPGSGHNDNDGNHNGNGNGWGNGGDGGGGYGGTNGNGGTSPSAPLDGGLSLLMIAGVGLGVRKTLGKKKE